MCMVAPILCLVFLDLLVRQADFAGSRAYVAPQFEAVPPTSTSLSSRTRTALRRCQIKEANSTGCLGFDPSSRIPPSVQHEDAESEVALQVMWDHYDLSPDTLHRMPCLVGEVCRSETAIPFEVSEEFGTREHRGRSRTRTRKARRLPIRLRPLQCFHPSWLGRELGNHGRKELRRAGWPPLLWRATTCHLRLPFLLHRNR